MSNANKKILITDTSVLINFLNIDRMDLLEAYPADICITEDIAEEVTHHFSHQRERLDLPGYFLPKLLREISPS